MTRAPKRGEKDSVSLLETGLAVGTRKRSIWRWDPGAAPAAATDRLVVEAPLEISVHGQVRAVTLRTPGQDEALALGLALTEGWMAHPSEIGAVSRPLLDGAPDRHRVAIEAPTARPGRRRIAVGNSACGLCAVATLDDVFLEIPKVAHELSVDPAWAAALPDKMRARQPVFEATGALHAAALFELGGEALCVCEDIGRHNAVDKALGIAAQGGAWPLSGFALCVSSRAGFEIAQKAACAGIKLLVAVSAPSEMAVALAEACGMTLCGFARGGALVVYTHPQGLFGADLHD